MTYGLRCPSAFIKPIFAFIWCFQLEIVSIHLVEVGSIVYAWYKNLWENDTMLSDNIFIIFQIKEYGLRQARLSSSMEYIDFPDESKWYLWVCFLYEHFLGLKFEGTVKPIGNRGSDPTPYKHMQGPLTFWFGTTLHILTRAFTCVNT